jgi:hypothetical protein
MEFKASALEHFAKAKALDSSIHQTEITRFVAIEKSLP